MISVPRSRRPWATDRAIRSSSLREIDLVVGGKGKGTAVLLSLTERKTRKHYSAEEKIRIVLAGLRGEESIAALCRREGIAESLYYSWSKEFLEAGKQRLAGDTARQATAPEVKELRSEAAALKEVVADLTLENRLLKKSMVGDGEDDA